MSPKKEFESISYYKGLKHCLEQKKKPNTMTLGTKVAKTLIFCRLKIVTRFKVRVTE